MSAAGTLVLHLRLPFQAALSAVFLWGVFLATGRFDLWTWISYASFVVGLWGGATAFNSFYDRDRGPVGGLRRPPPIRPALLPFSLAVQAAGLVGVFAVSLRLAGLYLVSAALFCAYSHPAVRTKSHPWLSIATVATASGAFAVLAGAWSAEGQETAGTRGRVLLGMLSCSLAIAGFYPLTQLGQEREDGARGDRTFALVYGRRASFAWAMVLLGVATSLNVALALDVLGWAAACGLAAGQAGVAVGIRRWLLDPDLDDSSRSDGLVYASAAVYATLVTYRSCG